MTFARKAFFGTDKLIFLTENTLPVTTILRHCVFSKTQRHAFELVCNGWQKLDPDVRHHNSSIYPLLSSWVRLDVSSIIFESIIAIEDEK
jgi:hypothetical protein